MDRSTPVVNLRDVFYPTVDGNPQLIDRTWAPGFPTQPGVYAIIYGPLCQTRILEIWKGPYPQDRIVVIHDRLRFKPRDVLLHSYLGDQHDTAVRRSSAPVG